MNIIDQLLADQPKEEALLQTWQFEISKWILSIMHERKMTQRDIARIARMTEPQISALIHCETNATLATLARLAALLDADLLAIVMPSQLRYVSRAYPLEDFDVSESSTFDPNMYKEPA